MSDSAIIAALEEAVRNDGRAGEVPAVVARSSKLNPPPQPHRNRRGERSVPVWDGKRQVYVWARVSTADFKRVSQHAWRLDKDGYPRTTIWRDRKLVVVLLHRLVANAPPGASVIHLHTHDKLDCRRRALRIATKAQKQANTRRRRTAEPSQYRGVTRRRHPKRPFEAALKHEGKTYYLGSFATAEKAARAYNRKAKEVWGEFAQTNRLVAR